MLCLFLLSSFAFAQSDIQPGIGVGKLKLGMSYADVTVLMGEPSVKTDMEKYKTSLDKNHYPLKQFAEFYQGFDFTLTYFESSNKTEIPAFRLFFKNNKLTGINLSTIYVKEKIEKCKLQGKVLLGAKEDDAQKLLGNGTTYTIVPLPDSQTYDWYYSKGIAYLIDTSTKPNTVSNVKIFTPFTAKEIADIRK